MSFAIATTLDAKVTTLAKMVDAVCVTTDSTPPTSLASRDWISPVLVRVKNAIDRVCRCEYRRSRKSRITCWPTLVVSSSRWRPSFGACAKPKMALCTVMGLM